WPAPTFPPARQRSPCTSLLHNGRSRPVNPPYCMTATYAWAAASSTALPEHPLQGRLLAGFPSLLSAPPLCWPFGHAPPFFPPTSVFSRNAHKTLAQQTNIENN